MNQEDERKKRLAQALRENLRRRKGQARENAASSEVSDQPAQKDEL